jgi:hypothetical protein
MRRVALMMTALAFATACDDNGTPAGPSNSGPIVFTAQLSAANENPPITGAEANARGSVTITFTVPRDNAGNITGPGSATFAVQLSGFPAGTAARNAHIHTGATGANGGVYIDTSLTPAAPILLNDGTGSLTITQSDLPQDRAQTVVANPAGHYFNVHTAANPGGAVRGQLTRTQ